MVSNKLLEELKEILEKQHKRELSPEEISETGCSLVEYFELAHKIANHKTLTKKED